MSVLGDLVSDIKKAREQREAELRVVFRGMCAHHLIVLIMDHYGLTYDEVNAQLWDYNDSFWGGTAMDTPDGWVGIAWTIALNCGADLAKPPLPITLH